jgi:hypothetical protein
MSTPLTASALTQNKPNGAAPVAEAIIVRLENIPASPANRKDVEDRIRKLNRDLEHSGTPFRVRLL